jgi:4-hydroxybenzoate polyprenyltransferase
MRNDSVKQSMRRIPGSSYLELIRPANVATALADVLAGYAVAGLPDWTRLIWLLLSTACLYAGGVVLNDYYDRELDSRERPERPIPSGRVRPASAARFGGSLLVTGVVLAWMATTTAGMIAAGTAVSILLYDSWGKRQTLLGPVNMGLCRGLNLMLGMAAAPAVLEFAWYLATLPIVYIAAVTAVSRGEVHGGRRGIAAFALISLVVVLFALLGLSVNGAAPWWAGALSAVLAWRVLPAFAAVYRKPDPGRIRQAVRAGVLALVLLDAVIGASYGGALYSLLILATAVLAGSLARVFAVT